MEIPLFAGLRGANMFPKHYWRNLCSVTVLVCLPWFCVPVALFQRVHGFAKYLWVSLLASFFATRVRHLELLEEELGPM